MKINEKAINLFFILLVISSTIAVIENKEKQQAELRQAAFHGIDVLNLSDKGNALSPEEQAFLKNISKAINARAVNGHELALRKVAFDNMNRLQNGSVAVAQAEQCAMVIHQAVRAHVVTYPELGAGSYFTIEEMVKHVEWGGQLEWVNGY